MSTYYGVPLQRSAPLRLDAHPDRPTAEGWREWVALQTRPIAVDLFAGAGGLSLGLEAAGYRVALAVDVNQWALETHRHNFPGLALDLDLGDPVARAHVVNMLDGVSVDLVAGGPPCQPYSRAGRSKIRNLVALGTRHAVDHRRELWKAFLDVVVRVRPRAVLMENVPDMALGDDMAVLRSMMSTLEAAGYEVDAALVNAPDYGVPQHRQRLILVGLQACGAFSWPARSQQQITLKDAIGDLPSIDSARGETGHVETAYAGATSDFQKRARARCTGPNKSVV
ncbi:MAG: DNA cytosine methyltransferase, partial [Acidimicrobiia bacterium]